MPQSSVISQFHGYYINNPININFGFNQANKEFRIEGALLGAQTASSAQVDAFPTSNFQWFVVGINVGTVSGTSPTLTVNFQTSTTFGGSYTTVASSQQITATGVYYFFAPVTAKQPPNQGNFARISFTIGGTTPSFTVNGIALRPLYITN